MVCGLQAGTTMTSKCDGKHTIAHIVDRLAIVFLEHDLHIQPISRIVDRRDALQNLADHGDLAEQGHEDREFGKLVIAQLLSVQDVRPRPARQVTKA